MNLRNPPIPLLALILLPLLAGLAAPAPATTFAPIADGALFDGAALVVEGAVRARREPLSGPYTDYTIDVARVLRGELFGRTATVRVPGGPTADGLRLEVWGAPRLAAGDRVLLFLDPRPDGEWGVVHLALGAFRGVRQDDRLLARRDLFGAERLDGTPAAEAERDFAAFARWLVDRGAGLRRAADYFVADARPRAATAPFSYIGGQRQRWFEFERGASVGWRAHQNGQPEVPGGGFDEFQRALAAWNGDPGTNVNYQFLGTTFTSTGFQRFDNQNVLLFEDPQNEVSGNFTCSSPGNGSGVLAIGGTWYDDADPSPIPIRGADIVINDGAGCWFATSKRAEQVYAHELGHTLGLGHSCGDGSSGPCNTTAKSQALMRATAHADERGAALADDDRAGLATLYGSGGGGGGGKIKPPTNLTGQALSSTEVRLRWADNSNNEVDFTVELKVGKNAFTPLATLPADSTQAVLTGLDPNRKYVFRVFARNTRGAVGYSNNAVVRTVP